MEKIRDLLGHYFVPRETNNYRAKSLHLDFLSMYLVLSLLLVLITSTTVYNVLGIATDISVSDLLSATNKEREAKGIAPLSINEQLVSASHLKAEDMFSKDYWAHIGPSGETPWSHMIRAGYEYKSAGENLAKNFCCSGDVVREWMNSPTHRANILNPDYTEIGFTVMNGKLLGEETTLVVQMFGKPTHKELSSPIVVRANEKDVEDIIIANVSPTTIPPSPTNTEINDERNLSFIAGSQSQKNDTTLISRFISPRLSQNMTFVVFALLALALIADLYYAYKLDIIRLTGKNIAHGAIVVIMIAGLFFIRGGSIL